jgi:hypothetical protein
VEEDEAKGDKEKKRREEGVEKRKVSKDRKVDFSDLDFFSSKSKMFESSISLFDFGESTNF